MAAAKKSNLRLYVVDFSEASKMNLPVHLHLQYPYVSNLADSSSATAVPVTTHRTDSL